jgi:hypothetical protein
MAAALLRHDDFSRFRSGRAARLNKAFYATEANKKPSGPKGIRGKRAGVLPWWASAGALAKYELALMR